MGPPQSALTGQSDGSSQQKILRQAFSPDQMTVRSEKAGASAGNAAENQKFGLRRYLE